jgi:hypothetical protein
VALAVTSVIAGQRERSAPASAGAVLLSADWSERQSLAHKSVTRKGSRRSQQLQATLLCMTKFVAITADQSKVFFDENGTPLPMPKCPTCGQSNAFYINSNGRRIQFTAFNCGHAFEAPTLR